ncbi:MAG: L-threonylcarbamoyladenylate synthase [Methanotrichaceae archaeon]|nr:L-threonylcarbamoyladenylate synthase [Methanotrichaceae archaeon]
MIVYPTETVYGLGANALDEQAILRVFQIKKRPLSMPIFLAVSSFEMLEKVAEVSERDLELLREILPGPVSVLVKKRNIVPDILTAGLPHVGIRYPDHEVALRIIDQAGPITSTSANRTGSPPPTSTTEVSLEIAERVDMVVDGGKSRYSEPSTLLDLTSRKIIRPGAALGKVLKAIT